MSVLGRAGEDCINRNVSTPYNKQLARKLSAMSTVLLKNEPAKKATAQRDASNSTGSDGSDNKLGSGPLLPLSKTAGLKIALIGPDAASPYTAGSGSGGVLNSNVAVSPLEAFQRLAAAATSASDTANVNTGGNGNNNNNVGVNGGGMGMEVLYSNASSLDSAVAAADGADVAIIFASAHSGEGSDRKNLLLQPIG
jgi:hypothetical protein